MTDLKKQVQTFRNAARDIAKMHKIENKMEYRAELRKIKSEIMDKIVHLNKSLAVAKYNLDKLDKAHPNYDEMLKNAEADIKYFTDCIETKTKDIACWDEKLAKVDVDIEAIVTGEKKVLLETINDTTHTIIDAIADDVAKAANDIDLSEEDN